MAEFRKPSRICGVIFNDCSESFFNTYAPSIEEESGIPVLGYLPHMEEAGFESRHLGLMTAEEIDDLAERIVQIGYKMDETIDLERLIEVTGWQDGLADAPVDSVDNSPVTAGSAVVGTNLTDTGVPALPVKIAVARDAAFNFIYEETLAALERAGADIEFFSPINDKKLPDGTCGIYLPGGYPELYGKELQANASMRGAVKDAVENGMPTIAECGGFLYLSSKLADADGKEWDMAGVLPGFAANTGKLVRFGYGHISSDKDSMILRKGDELPVHEFHYWDTNAGGGAMRFAKATGSRNWEFGFASDTLYAGFPHLYPAGNGGLIAKRFVDAAAKYQSSKAGETDLEE